MFEPPLVEGTPFCDGGEIRSWQDEKITGEDFGSFLGAVGF
jgi:hypothetical protein